MKQLFSEQQQKLVEFWRGTKVNPKKIMFGKYCIVLNDTYTHLKIAPLAVGLSYNPSTYTPIQELK